MLTNIVMILGGFFLLTKGADYLVGGASSIARKFGISALVVGLTVIAFGTSAPEFFVNVISAAGGNTAIAVGNVLGSNLANILLVLGITAMIAPLKLESSTVWKEIPFTLLAAIMVLVFGSDVLLDGAIVNSISRIEGVALLGFFLIFIVYTFGLREKTGEHPESQIEQMAFARSLFYTIGGLAALGVGGQLVVAGATSVASSLGVSDNLIALTVVALGTSLPELMASVVAARKGHQDLAIGNVVGSSIFNIFFVLSSSAIVAPLAFADANITDAVMVVFATFGLFVSLFAGRKHVISKRKGALLVGLYFAYMLYVILRG